MADSRLQWRQLTQDQPNVASLLNTANRGFNNAAEAASSILGSYDAGRIKKNDVEVANELAALDTQEEIDSYFANGGLKGRDVSENIINQALGRQKDITGFANTRSSIRDRDGRLAIAGDVNSRAGDLHGVAMTDHQVRQGRDRELRGLSDEVVAARRAGERFGSSGRNDPASFITYSNQNATRNKPISDKLIQSMSFLNDMGVRMDVISGGQDAKGEGDRRTGSTRHDHGNAADVDFYIGDRKLDWNNQSDLPLLEEIVGRARANGVTGIGAGDDYMGAGRFHVGFGPTAVWGKNGDGENAPDFLERAVANAAQYTNSQGNINVQQASQGVANGQADPRDILAASVANSEYLSLDDVDSILNGSDAATKRGDDRIAEELSEQMADLTAQLTMDAIADPNNLTPQDMMGQISDRAAASGADSSEVLDIQTAAEKILSNSPGLQSRLAPTVADDVARDAAVQSTLDDERRRFAGTDQNRAINDISRYTEDPSGQLANDLALSADTTDFDPEKLRGTINSLANEYNVEPSVMAVAMRDTFERDPGWIRGEDTWHGLGWDVTRNTLENQFDLSKLDESLAKLSPDARRDFDRGQDNIEIMEAQMGQIRTQQNRIQQQLKKLSANDPRRRSLEAQLIALDGQLEAIYSSRTNTR